MLVGYSFPPMELLMSVEEEVCLIHSGEVYEKLIYSSNGTSKKGYFGIWYKQNVGMNHIHPLNDLGRLLPIAIVYNEPDITLEKYYKSWQVIKTLRNMSIDFQPWSSVREFDTTKGEIQLVFRFTDKSDAAIFKLVWDSNQ